MHADCMLHMILHGMHHAFTTNVCILCRDDNVKTPREHIHQKFLFKICKGSDFKGLKYRGGPELKCNKCHKTVLMESVCYENGEGSKEAKKTVRHCPGDNHDINEEVLY